jgi:hypothetical protein
MGMFDHISAPCPNCEGGELYGQTKAGDCSLNTYYIEPEMDASDAAIVSDEWLFCSKCKAQYRVKVGEMPKVKVILEKIERP